jgi:hypothetical protein
VTKKKKKKRVVHFRIKPLVESTTHQGLRDLFALYGINIIDLEMVTDGAVFGISQNDANIVPESIIVGDIVVCFYYFLLFMYFV